METKVEPTYILSELIVGSKKVRVIDKFWFVFLGFFLKEILKSKNAQGKKTRKSYNSKIWKW